MSRLIRLILWLLNLLAILWLFICKWASLYNPVGHPSILSLFSFTTSFAIIINVLFIIYWLLSKKKLRFIYSFITIILLWGMLRPLVGFHYFSSNNLNEEDGNLKIMTWNVHLFDLGVWTKDKASKTQIINLINKENPDVLCLEEYYRDSENSRMPYTDIIQSLGYPYVAFSKQYTIPKRKITIQAPKNAKIEVGNIVFSKFPLQNINSYNLGAPDNTMLGTDVVIDSTHSINLNVVHLTSVHFGEEDMAYIEDIKNKGIDKQDKQKSKSLFKKLTYSSAQRAILANHIDSLKRFADYPIVICGDFNDVPSSYVYEKIKGDLIDPFILKGAGLGRTYRNISPTLRIDYIFYDQSAFNLLGYGRRKVKLSDHYPVIVNLAFKDSKAL